MKAFYKCFIFSCAFLLFFLLVSHQAYAAVSENGTKVQINDEILSMPDESTYLDNTGHLQVPLRLIMEKLGLKVSHQVNGSEVKVTLTNSTQSIVLITGESQAELNGASIKMYSPAVFSQGKVFIPLRFITEILGITIQWDEKNKIAILDADKKYHAPAWYAPEVQSVQIQKIASNYLGTPYVWGGTSPQGFDCSGFVRYVYQQNGVQLPRTSSEMYESIGTPVTNLQKGDLVFFANHNKIDHVGIYIGNNEFISAASKGVRVDSLASYWGNKYVGAKRVV
ncbi:MAG: cell wall lytic [Bacilli bacterium]|nr:cell wall lytic [Bacilli bacterium]